MYDSNKHKLQHVEISLVPQCLSEEMLTVSYTAQARNHVVIAT
jgi:hypothetical protein